MHGLREGLVESVEQHEKLGIARSQIVPTVVIAERAFGIDRMHDRPRQRKKRHAFALELERDELALIAPPSLSPRQQDSRFEIDDLTAPLIDDAEHEGLHV